MNIVVLSRQLRALAPFDSWLGDVTKDAVLFCDATRVEGYSCFRDVRPMQDYETSALVELEVLRLARSWPIHRIVATSESDILRAGRLRTHLGLPGQSGESAFAFRNKLEMKRRVAAHAKTVRVPEFCEVREGYDVIAFVERHGYPVIVKPIDGAGGEGTTVLRTEDDLAAFLSRGVSHGTEVEKFISGDFFHVDGLVLDGRMVLCWPSRYVREYFIADASVRWRANGGFTGSQMLDPDHPLVPRLRAAAVEVLDALPTPSSTSFHLEVFHTREGEICFCEIASRTGGALVNPTLELAFGINLNRQFIRAQAGLAPDEDTMIPATPKRLFGWGLLPPREGVFLGHTAAAPDAPWVHRFEWSGKPGKRSTGPHNAVDQVANFIVEFTDAGSGTERLISTWKWADDHARWGA